MNDRADLPQLLAHPTASPVDKIPAAIGELERIKVTLWSRLAQPERQEEDRLLSIVEAMSRTGMSRTWLCRNAAAGNLPCARKVGRRLLFSSVGLARWLAARGPV